jgi:putative spermidine/putrescine transport system permease protein
MKSFAVRSSNASDSSSVSRPKGAALPGLTLLVVIIILPVVWITGYSLLYSLGGIGMFSRGRTTAHWRSVIDRGELWSSLLYSVSIAAAVTAFTVTLASVFVLTVPQSRHSSRWLSLICVPLATPAAVTAVIVYQLLNPGGLLARLANHGGLLQSPAEFPILVNDVRAVGMIIAGTCVTLPLLTLFQLKTWTTANIDAYCRLAQSLGSTQFQARWRIAGPMLLIRSRSIILLTFLWTLGSYEIPLLLGRQSPQMYSVLIQRRSGQFNLLDRPEAFVLSIVYLAVVSPGVVLLLQWRRNHE